MVQKELVEPELRLEQEVHVSKWVSSVKCLKSEESLNKVDMRETFFQTHHIPQTRFHERFTSLMYFRETFVKRSILIKIGCSYKL